MYQHPIVRSGWSVSEAEQAGDAGRETAMMLASHSVESEKTQNHRCCWILKRQRRQRQESIMIVMRGHVEHGHEGMMKWEYSNQESRS